MKQLADYVPADCSFAGPDKVDEYASPPRITWEPDEERITAPRAGLGGPGASPAIWQREVTLFLKCWGETQSATEALYTEFIAAIHPVLSPFSYGLTGAKWVQAGVNAKGFVVVVALVLKMPIVRVEPTAPISAINQNNRINGNPI